MPTEEKSATKSNPWLKVGSPTVAEGLEPVKEKQRFS
jgi:hypothetical protein